MFAALGIVLCAVVLVLAVWEKRLLRADGALQN
jgi:hypothetical protein